MLEDMTDIIDMEKKLTGREDQVISPPREVERN